MLRIDTSNLLPPMDFKNLHEDSPSPHPHPVEYEEKFHDEAKKKTFLPLNNPKETQEKPEVFCLQYSQDSRFLAVGCGDGGIRAFNTIGRVSYTLGVGLPNKLPITCLRFRPASATSQISNILLSGGADGVLSHWHLTSQKCVFSIQEEDNQIYTIDYRPDAEVFATAGRDTKIRIYEENTKTLLRTLAGGSSQRNTGHSNRIYAVKFKPDDPNVLISGGWDNTVQIWDTRVGSSIASFYGPHICGEALDIHGDKIVTGSWRPDDALQVWDFKSRKLIQTLHWSYGAKTTENSRKLPEMLYAACFSPDGKYIAAGGCGTNEGKLFDAETFHCVDRAFMGEKGVYAVGFAPNGRKLAFGGGASDVCVWDL